MDEPRRQLEQIAKNHGLSASYPEEVQREVEGWLERPGVDDPQLLDLSALPFVTVDGPHTRDLDQALYVERSKRGHRVLYAIADASYYVRPGSALFDEALRRGASYYLPDHAIPMLPRELSEGLVSLNAGVPRRALVFETRLAQGATVESTQLRRARIQSRAKLAFGEVQELLDGSSSSALKSMEFAESLRQFKVVGELRDKLARSRNMVRYRRNELKISLGSQAMPFVAAAEVRHPVELYNEQLSLLCNVEGAKFLKSGDRANDDMQPIYRIHPRPEKARVDALERQIKELCRARSLPKGFVWRRSEPLASYLRRLPDSGELKSVSAAIHRQAMLMNLRSSYSSQPGLHYGVGAEVYARFSAPMREVVGVFCHKEAIEKLTGQHQAGPGAPDDDSLRALVIESANRSRDVQRELEHDVNRLVIDALFAGDAAQPKAQRPRRGGVVMGITDSKLHVLLEQPPVDTKVYVRHLERASNQSLSADKLGTRLSGPSGRDLVRLGDHVRVSVVERDSQEDRWVLSLERA